MSENRVTWKKKLEDNKVIEVNIEEMDNDYLEKAILIGEKRQVIAFQKLKRANSLVEALKKEAKKRGIQASMMLAENPESSIVTAYQESAEILNTVERSIKRKEKALQNGK